MISCALNRFPISLLNAATAISLFIQFHIIDSILFLFAKQLRDIAFMCLNGNNGICTNDNISYFLMQTNYETIVTASTSKYQVFSDSSRMLLKTIFKSCF
jgi:hypothetical protein